MLKKFKTWFFSFWNGICSLAPNLKNGQKQVDGHDVHASKIRTIILNPHESIQIDSGSAEYGSSIGRYHRLRINLNAYEVEY